MAAATGTARGILTRIATPGDGRRCAEIFLEGRRAAFPWQPADRFGLDDYAASTEDSLVLVAEAQGTVAGFVSADPCDRFIRALFIDPAWQSRGIGTILLLRAQIALPGPVRLACAARNEAACAFYERRGWTPVAHTLAGSTVHILYQSGYAAENRALAGRASMAFTASRGL